MNAAGGVNTFKGASVKAMQQLSKDALASADVDVLVVGSYKPNESLKAEADALFRVFRSGTPRRPGRGWFVAS